jgi:hypothetical protein
MTTTTLTQLAHGLGIGRVPDVQLTADQRAELYPLLLSTLKFVHSQIEDRPGFVIAQRVAEESLRKAGVEL